MGQSTSERLSTLPIHFSRADEIDPLIRILKKDFFAAVTGPSGCGKSTLVLRYLYSALIKAKDDSGDNAPTIEGKAGKTWKIVNTSPGANPIGNLADALARAGEHALYQAGEKDSAFRDDIELLLRNQDNAVKKLYDDQVALQAEPFNLLIIVDQLQDLARYLSFYQPPTDLQNRSVNRSPYGIAGDDVRFINQLMSACDSRHPIYLVLLSDNSHQEYYARHRGLLEKMNSSRFTVSNAGIESVRSTLGNLKKEAPELAAFEQRLVQEYAALSERTDPDPYAMLKLNLSIYLALDEGKIPGLEGVVDYFIQEKIFQPLSPELKNLCMLLFKSLTGATNYSHADRIPRNIASLVALCARPPMISLAPRNGIQTIIQAFNAYNEPFLTRVGPEDLPDYAILDITSNALTDSWKQLKEWSTAEINDSEVFASLYRDALDYFSHYHQNPQADPADFADKLYTGASLLNALRWESQCLPNEAWAKRYLPETADPNPLKGLQLVIEGKSLADMSKLELSRAFLKRSNQKYNDELKQKDDALRVLNRQRKWMSIAGVVIFIFLIISAFNWYSVRMEKRNIELMNYIKLLDYYDILDLSASSKYTKLDSINHKLVKTNAVNNERRALQLLQDEHVLHLDDDNEILKRIATDALLNLNTLEQGVKGAHILMKDPEALKRVKDDIMDIYSRYASLAARDTGFMRQVPPLYQTLYAHCLAAQVDYQNDGMDASDPSDTIWRYVIIHPNCLATNLQNGKEYAFGGINGQVYFKRLGSSLKPLGTVTAPVTAVSFGENGEEILVGTEIGQLFCFKQPTQQGAADTNVAEPILTLPHTFRVSFIGFDEQSGILIVGSPAALHFYWKNPLTQSYLLLESFPIPLDFTVHISWSDDRNLLMVTSFSKSILFELNWDSRENTWFKQLCTISHPGVTMYRGAVTQRVVKGQNTIWLALGTAAGRIWYGHIEPQTIKPGMEIEFNDPSYFYSLRLLESPVTALAFSPGLPQLAVGSGDGLLSLWNLQGLQDLSLQQKNKKGLVETIRMHTFGQGITNLQYLSKDHLTVYENNYGWTIKTSLEAMWKDLNCIYHDCPPQ